MQSWKYQGDNRDEILRRLSRLHPRRFEQVQELLAQIRTLPSVTLAPLLVAVRAVILLSLPPESPALQVVPAAASVIAR